MSAARREISAYFRHEPDARRSINALEAMFEVYRSNTDEPGTEYSRLLTIVLPEIPSLATFFVDSYLMIKVRELVERNGGAVWDSTVDAAEAMAYDPDDESGPEVVEEIRRRLATPRSQWFLVDAAERNRRSQDEDLEVPDEH